MMKRFLFFTVVFVIAMSTVKFGTTTSSYAATAQSTLGSLATGMAPGTWAQLDTSININSTLTEIGTGGTSGFMMEFCDKGVWDPIGKRLYIIGSDHNGGSRTMNARFVMYDDATNTWTNLPAPFWFSPIQGGNAMHGYEHTTIDPVARKIYTRPMGDDVLRGMTGYVYDIPTSTWSTLPINNVTQYNSCCIGLQWFPERASVIWPSLESGVNGGVVEYKSGAWSRLWPVNLVLGSYQGFAQYNPVLHLVWFGGGTNAETRNYTLNATGTVTTLSNAPLSMVINQTVQTIDPSSGDGLVLDNSRTLWTYKFQTATWTHVAGTPGIFSGSVNTTAVNGVVATPISNYGVVLFTKCLSQDTCTMYIYKHSQGGDVQPPAAPTNLRVQ